jgi:hypothetical protein
MTMSKLILVLALLASAATAAFANAPGGAYVQCNGLSAPVRCTPDGW